MEKGQEDRPKTDYLAGSSALNFRQIFDENLAPGGNVPIRRQDESRAALHGVPNLH